jgi:hypothetical protein
VRIDLLQRADELEYYGALIQVRLTVPLQRKFFLLERGLPSDHVVPGMALIDTGASVSAVDDGVMAELDIPALDLAETFSPHGLASSNVYNASAVFPQIDSAGIELSHVLGCSLRHQAVAFGRPVVMLLGRDLLRNRVLTYDGRTGRVIVEV